MLRALKQQKCILSQFWRLEVQDQGVGWAMLPLRLYAESLVASNPWLAAVSFPPLSPPSQGFLPCIFMSSSCNDTRYIGLTAHPVLVGPHLYLTNSMCNDPIPR